MSDEVATNISICYQSVDITQALVAFNWLNSKGFLFTKEQVNIDRVHAGLERLPVLQ